MALIKVPFVKHEEGLTCGADVLKQLLELKKIKHSKESILQSLKIKEFENTDLPRIAVALIEVGITPKVYINFTSYIDRDKEILSQLENLLRKTDSKKQILFLEALLKLIKFNAVEFNTFGKEELKEFIKKNNIIITVVNSNIFSEGKFPKGQHTILLTGYEEKDFIFTSSKEFRKSQEKSIAAMMAAKAPTIVVIPNET